MRRLLLAWSAPLAMLAADPKVADDGFGELVLVPAGSFRMGDTFGDGEPRERPAHTVDLDAFYIGRFEVTNAQWRKFRDDPAYNDAKLWPAGRPVPKDQIPYWTQANNHGGGTPDSDPFPVIGVNWDSAVAYCNWVSAKTGKKYRLAFAAIPVSRGRMGEGGARHRFPPIPVGQLDRRLAGQLRRDPAVRHRSAGRLLRRQPARAAQDPVQRVALWRVRHGRQYHGVVPGLVQPRLLFALGRVALLPGAPHDRIPCGEGPLAR
jgi:hypothetical protein